MTTFEARKDKRGFFTLYKPGQGKILRWGTVGAMALLVLTGTFWLAMREFAASTPIVQTIAGAVWTLIGAGITFWMVNSPKMAEFLIMTESEMRKVSWPTRKDVIAATKVVILCTLILGVLLWIVDLLFLSFFKAIGVA